MIIYVNKTTNIVTGLKEENIIETNNTIPQNCIEVETTQFPFYWGVDWYTYTNNTFKYTNLGKQKLKNEFNINPTEVFFTEAPSVIAKRNAEEREKNIRRGTNLGSTFLTVNDEVINRLSFAKLVLMVDSTKEFDWKFTDTWDTVNKDNVDAIILAISDHVETQFKLNKQADTALSKGE